MKAWKYDADSILKEDFSLNEIIQNQVIEEYLNDKEGRNKYFLIAPKGLGKTYILKAKSIAFRDNHPDYKFIPQDIPCEKITIIAHSLGIKNIGKLESKDKWMAIWKWCISLSILRKLNIPIPDVLLKKLGKSDEINEIFNIVIANIDFFLFQNGDLLHQDILPELRKVNTNIAIFIDSSDQAIGDIAANFNPTDREERALIKSFWVNSQLGLLYSIYEIRQHNPHLKIFSTLRYEAYSEDLSEKHDLISNYVSLIEYDKLKLKEIFIQNIKNSSKEQLALPNLKKTNPIKSLFGFEKIPWIIDKSKEEDIFDFIYRHTFGRPRELVQIGGEIANNINRIPPELNNIDEIRKRVHNQSVSIFVQHLNEVIPAFDESKLSILLDVIQSNIFSKKDIETIDNKLLFFFYKIGLIGCSKRTLGGNTFRQDFVTDNKYSQYKLTRLPDSDFFFIHPALAQHCLNLEMPISIYSKLIIGDNYVFEIPEIKKQKKTSRKNGEIKVFIASPSDFGKSRKKIIDDLGSEFYKKGFHKSTGYDVVTEYWENLASQGGYAQDVINSKLLPTVDIIVAIFKHKLGSPVKDGDNIRSESGTVEELLFAFDKSNRNRPLCMVYFYSTAPDLKTYDYSSKDDEVVFNEWKRL